MDLRRFLDLDLFLGRGEQMVAVVDVEATFFVYSALDSAGLEQNIALT